MDVAEVRIFVTCKTLDNYAEWLNLLGKLGKLGKLGMLGMLGFVLGGQLTQPITDIRLVHCFQIVNTCRTCSGSTP